MLQYVIVVYKTRSAELMIWSEVREGAECAVEKRKAWHQKKQRAEMTAVLHLEANDKIHSERRLS